MVTVGSTRTPRFGALLGALLLSACGQEGGFRNGDIDILDSGTGPRDASIPFDAGPQDDSGTPGATFVERVIGDEFRHGQGIQVVDMDGDGDLDVVVALSLTDTIYIYFNEEGGTRWTVVPVATMGSIVAMEVEVADLDGDGDLDIAAVGLFDRNGGGFNSPGEVTWFENGGDPRGRWTAHDITGRTFWAPRYIEAGDITGDGAHDLIVASMSTTDVNGAPRGNGVHWFRNAGDRFIGPTPVDAELAGVQSLIVADVDGNGVADILAVGNESDAIAWYENMRRPGTEAEAPAFTKHVIATPNAPFDITLANMDDDPELELVATLSRGEGGALVYFDPPADPRQPWREVVISETFGGGRNTRLYAADLDGDGRIDVAVGSPDTSSIRVFFNAPDGWVSQVVHGDYTGLNWLTGGDIDGDGRADLLTSTYELSGQRDQLSWWKNQP